MNSKLVLVVVVLALYVSVISTKEIRDTASNIKNGLNLAKNLGDYVVSKNFTNVIGKLATAVTPFLGIVGPFVSFIMGFVGHSESAELKAIKHLFTEVDNRFDRVDLQFTEVKRLIDWSKIQVQYSDIEQKITAVNREFENIYKFATAAVKTTTAAFVSNYESDYQNSGSKLYDGIMNEGRVFGDGLFTAVIKNTEYDREKSQTFMLGLLQLLMKASKLELAYHQLKGHTAALHNYEHQWRTRLSHIRSKMLSTDRTIVHQYHDQSGKDIDNYLTKHQKNAMNNNDFNNGLYAFLAKKYYWRDWLTVTYNDITGDNVHWVGECNGHIKFRNHGRNIMVASVDGHKAHIDMTQAKSIVNHVHSCDVRTVHRPSTHTIHHRIDSHTAYDTFPSSVKDHCSPYAAQGVIRYEDEVYFKAAPNRMYKKSQERCNHVFIFG